MCYVPSVNIGWLIKGILGTCLSVVHEGQTLETLVYSVHYH